MRLDVEVDPPSERPATPSGSSYSSSDPETAQKVTERLASLFIEENLRDRESLAENTSLFLEQPARGGEAAADRSREESSRPIQKRNAGTLPLR